MNLDMADSISTVLIHFRVNLMGSQPTFQAMARPLKSAQYFILSSYSAPEVQEFEGPGFKELRKSLWLSSSDLLEFIYILHIHRTSYFSQALVKTVWVDLVD